MTQNHNHEKMPRLKPDDNILDDDWNEILELLNNSFGLDWLEKDSKNPLQMLWKRTDFVAQSELYILGSAIRCMSSIDEKYVQYQIKKIKDKDYNTCKEHSFELIGISYFQNSSYNMLPTSSNYPGVDAITTFNDDFKINWSFKNFGLSAHQKEFEDRCYKLEQLIKGNLEKYSINNCKIILNFLNEYPATADIWENINNDVLQNLKIFNGSPINLQSPLREISISKLDDNNEYSVSGNSYAVIVLSPYHKNEQHNFEGKLDGACANLIKHNVQQKDSSINGLFIHIPESMNLSNCTLWAEKYFTESENKPISCMLFYQPLVTMDIENNTTQIRHGFNFIIKKGAKINNQPHLIIPIGLPTTETVPMVLENGDEKIELNNIYAYQRGETYINAKYGEDKALKSTLSKIAPGVKTNAVFNMENQPPLIIQPKVFSPDDKLLIL